MNKYVIIALVIVTIIAAIAVPMAIIAQTETRVASFEVQFNVVDNLDIRVYSDSALANECPAWILGDLHRGDSVQTEFYVLNAGDPVDLVVNIDGAFVGVDPGSFHLDHDRSAACTFTVSIPEAATSGARTVVVSFDRAT